MHQKDISDTKMHEIIKQAIANIGGSMFGRYLLERFPMRLTDAKTYPDINAVLKQHGSPACTDGKEVYIEPTIMRDMLTRQYHALDGHGIKIERTEDIWRAQVSDKPLLPMGDTEMVCEVRDVLLHELTHAFNEHTKLRIAARKQSEDYKTRLSIACELQANDGICGRTYERSLLQQNKGVCNKRLHPETIGKHTLKGLFDAIKLNEQEQQQMSMARARAELREKLAKITGEYERIMRDIEESEKGDGEEQDKQAGGRNANPELDMDATSDEKLAGELQKRGLQQIKELILAALSDELRYDATTDSVIFDRVTKRRSHATYARPSRRIGATGGGYQLLKKGVKYTREYEYNKSRKLTVLAVDGSGSMRSQQQYVSAILDDLLRQVEAVAHEYNVEVHYENLQATIHRTKCDKFVPASSDEWKYRMRSYHANGGNDFDCVLKATSNIVGKDTSYDAITIINLSDGLDVLNDDTIKQTILGDYIERDKLQWVDALIAQDAFALAEANRNVCDDIYDIRTQVLIAKPLR